MGEVFRENLLEIFKGNKNSFYNRAGDRLYIDYLYIDADIFQTIQLLDTKKRNSLLFFLVKNFTNKDIFEFY